MKKVPLLHIQQFYDHDSVDNFYINTVQEHIETRHKDIALPHRHNFYLTLLFTKGMGIHEVDFISYPVVPGALFFLNPGQTHHWELSEDIEGYIFFHTREFYDLHFSEQHLTYYPFFYSMHSSPMLRTNGEKFAILAALFKLLMEENDGHKLLKKQRVLNLIEHIYIESARIYAAENKTGAPTQSHYSQKFSRLEELIEQHYKTEKSPAQYADMLNMSPKHLNRITQAATGKTTSDIILDRVLLEAKRELLLQRDSLAQIAQSLGYEDYAYFSRLFKKKAGITPTSFVSRYRKD
jgi:AraC family transcriptional activator of pobA